MKYRKSQDPGKRTMSPILAFPLSQIPTQMERMVIDMEDFRFYNHIGIDLPATILAIKYDIAVGKPVIGASTISQQLARTLFLNPQKNIFRKYFEALLSLELELTLSKRRILELYFNTIEWGPGIFGIGRAAESYFHKKPAELDQDEQARLVAIIASPLLHSPTDFESDLFLRDRYYFIKLTSKARELFKAAW